MWDDTADAASAICRCLCVSYGGLWDGVGQKPFFAVGVLSHVIVRLLRHLIRSFISGWRAQGIEPSPGHWHIFLSGFAGKAVVLSCPLRVDLQKKVLAPYPPVPIFFVFFKISVPRYLFLSPPHSHRNGTGNRSYRR